MIRIAITLMSMAVAQSSWAQEKSFADMVAVAQEKVVEIVQNIHGDDIRKLNAAQATTIRCFPGGDDKTPLARAYGSSGIRLGTGFIVNARGDVVTADHVVKAMMSLEACLAQFQVTPERLIGHQSSSSGAAFKSTGSLVETSGASFDVPFTIVAEDPAHDVAVLTPQANSVRPIVVVSGATEPQPPNGSLAKLNVDRPRDGSDVFTCGYPLAQYGSVTTSGRIASAWSQKTLLNAASNGIAEESETYILHMRVNHGNSGGPLFSIEDGSVLGIVVEISSTKVETGVAYAVPAKYIAALLNENKIPWQRAGPQH
jgi:S1-C subfamily serine protease